MPPAMNFWDWLVHSGLTPNTAASYYKPGGGASQSEFENAIRTAITNLNYASDPTASNTFFDYLLSQGAISGQTSYYMRGVGALTQRDIDDVVRAAGSFYASGGGAATNLDSPFGGRSLNNIPGKPEVWKVGGATYLVYMAPGTEADPVYMAWKATSEEAVQSFFGPGQGIVYDRNLTDAAFAAAGVLNFGSTSEIPPGAKDPFASWSSIIDVQAQTQPWILDSDYKALMAMSLVEGRPLTDAEIQTTRWWKTHTRAEREWMKLYHSDPLTAGQRLRDEQSRVRQIITQAGGGTAISNALVEFMAGKLTMGKWSDTYLADQIRALVDPYSGVTLDAELAARKDRTSVDSTQDQESEVRTLLHTWLGPAFGEWSNSEIARIAGTFRNDPDAQTNFVEQLKDQRLALLPEYTDRNISYQAIANTWKQFWMGQWGENPDEKDPLFLTVLRNNDIDESAKLMRREGLSRGIGKVTTDLSQAGLQLGNSERRPITIG